MSDDEWLATEPLGTLVDALVEDALRRYRIEEAEARAIIAETLSASEPLRRAAAEQKTPEKLRRTSVFRRAAGDARRQIYYHLRRYRPDEASDDCLARLEALEAGAPREELHRLAAATAAGHKSMAERMPSLDEFHRELFAAVSGFGTVLDVGCGVYPLVFPLDGDGNGVQRYVAADSSPQSIAAVQAYARARGDGRLSAVEWDLADGWGRLLDQGGRQSFDVALLLKLVPVVDRQARKLLPTLAQVPARTWVLSGSRTSLTKRASIERRERAILRRFVNLSGRTVRHEFTAGEEFVWVVQ